MHDPRIIDGPFALDQPRRTARIHNGSAPTDASPSAQLDPDAFPGCRAVHEAGLMGGLPVRTVDAGGELALRAPLNVLLDGTGTVDVVVAPGGTGCRHSLRVVDGGDFLVPTACVGDTRIGTALHATTACRVLIVDDTRYRRWLEVPRFAAELAEGLSQSVADAQMLLAIARHARVDRRLLFTLYAASERLAKVTNAGLRFDLHLTHARLGLLVGAARETVTKTLQQLSRSGAVVIENGTLTLPPPEGHPHHRTWTERTAADCDPSQADR